MSTEQNSQAGEVKEEEDVKPEQQENPGAAGEWEEDRQTSRYTSNQDNQAPYGRKRHHDDAHGYSYYEHREDKRSGYWLSQNVCWSTLYVLKKQRSTFAPCDYVYYSAWL